MNYLDYLYISCYCESLLSSVHSAILCIKYITGTSDIALTSGNCCRNWKRGMIDPLQNRAGKDSLHPPQPNVLARKAPERTGGRKIKRIKRKLINRELKLRRKNFKNLPVAHQRLTVKMERFLNEKNNVGHHPLGFLYI